MEAKAPNTVAIETRASSQEFMGFGLERLCNLPKKFPLGRAELLFGLFFGF